MTTEAKATHTPGPWTVAHYPNSRQSRVVARGGVEFLECANPGISTETWNANLRLIAAAPDLLDALKRIVGYDEGPLHSGATGTYEWYGRAHRVWSTAWAAIAKAEGR